MFHTSRTSSLRSLISCLRRRMMATGSTSSLTRTWAGGAQTRRHNWCEVAVVMQCVGGDAPTQRVCPVIVQQVGGMPVCVEATWQASASVGYIDVCRVYAPKHCWRPQTIHLCQLQRPSTWQAQGVATEACACLCVASSTRAWPQILHSHSDPALSAIRGAVCLWVPGRHLHSPVCVFRTDLP